jgi:hypothetical protein
VSMGYVADESRQCTGKRQYATASVAKKVAKRTMSNGGSACTAYRCPWCGWHHTGHRTAWRVRAARESG